MSENEPEVVEKPPKHVAAGELPAWEVDELPEPPSMQWGIKDVIGPGFMMVGAAIGGGEWLMGPKVATDYGGSIMWLALMSIGLQLIYNVEVIRYANYCGESMFVGFFRLFPGPRVWAWFYLFVDFFGLWPYLAASAAVPIAAVFLGHVPEQPMTNYMTTQQIVATTNLDESLVEKIRSQPKAYAQVANAQKNIAAYPTPFLEQMKSDKDLVRYISFAVFLLAFVPLLIGGKIYNALVKIMTVKIFIVLIYLTFVALVYVKWGTWFEIFAGFFFYSTTPSGTYQFQFIRGGIYNLLTTGDIALVGAFAAIAGQGGMNNAQFASYARDRGMGMGSKTGAIGSIVGGRDLALAHTGKCFLISAESMNRWRGWMRLVWRDQVAVWTVGCILGMAIPALVSLEFLRGMQLQDNEVAAKMADALRDKTQIAFMWYIPLIVGFFVLAPTQVTATEGLVRRWTEVSWSASKRLSGLHGKQVKYVYFTLLLAYLFWGLFVLLYLGDRQILIVKASGVIMNAALGLTAFHTLAVNCILLPKAVRPNWFMRIGMVLCGLFFIGIAVVTTPKTVRELKERLMPPAVVQAK
jgi:hypothetical protein